MYGNCIQFPQFGPRVQRQPTLTSNARGNMLTRKVKRLLSLTAVATPLFFAACSDNPFNPINDASGTYQLTVYAGRSIPATYTIQPGDPNYNMPNGGTLQVTG